MSPFIVKLLQLIVSLSILVVVHEFGHFLFSRLFKVRVEKFYAFFNPNFSILRFKKVNGKWRFKFFASNVPDSYEEQTRYNYEGKKEIFYKPVDIDSLPEDDWRRDPEHTEFGIGWIPFGGYCKIAGMIDESMDKGALQQEPKVWEFRTRPAWQRLLMMTGGVLFNLVLAFFIYSFVLFKWGDSYIPAQELAYGIEFNDHAKSLGFQDGDIILNADGKEIVAFGADMYRAVAKASEVVVSRNGAEISIIMPEELSLFDFARQIPFISIYSPMTVDSLVSGAGAQLADMMPGDTIISVNGLRANTWTTFQVALDAQRQSALSTPENHLLSLVINRPGKGYDTLSVSADQNFKIGIYHFTDEYSYKQMKYGLFEAIPAGISYGWETLTSYVSDFQYVFTKEGAKSLGGFGTIGSIFPSQWNWHAFWLMTAFLSIILAFMNILPIPALDGGHVLFLIVEIVIRRKPGDKFLEVANTVGMFLLLGLLLFANLNDLLRFFS